MDTLLGWFMIGSFFWWILTVGWVVWLFWAVEHESLASAFVNIVIYLVILQFLSKIDILGTIANNPFWVPLLFVGYLVIGILWSFVKWWLYVGEKVDEYKNKRAEFCRQHNIFELHASIPKELKETWTRKLGYGYKKPTAVESKGKITCWIICWPVSAIWSFIDDFVKQLVHRIIDKFRIFYQGISNRAFKGFSDDFDGDEFIKEG